ncbi:hypothetical protein CCMSSC00406_0007571 [Pleurotus cornucopiae]|uniref:Uncharacterized protein n=1 Tax=Pleurotus cornucopiae TaxID=5321 RepID=A0ACB7J7C4_PLECO|nr:hypothetical protein CCMSSC00406_0007571 [Pleurotus cornucopiae]
MTMTMLPHSHQHYLPVPSNGTPNPHSNALPESCREPYTNRTISLAASPLYAPSSPSTSTSRSLPSAYNVEQQILAPNSILYTSTQTSSTPSAGVSVRGRPENRASANPSVNIWQFTAPSPSPSPSPSKSTPPAPSTPPLIKSPTPPPKSTPTPKPTLTPSPESLELAKAKAQSLQRSRARVVAGMILHRVYCHAPRPNSPCRPPSSRSLTSLASRTPDSARPRGRSTTPTPTPASTSVSISAEGAGGGGGGSRLKEVIYSCYWDDDDDSSSDTESEGQGGGGSDAESEGTLVDEELERGEKGKVEFGEEDVEGKDVVHTRYSPNPLPTNPRYQITHSSMSH